MRGRRPESSSGGTEASRRPLQPGNQGVRPRKVSTAAETLRTHFNAGSAQQRYLRGFAELADDAFEVIVGSEVNHDLSGFLLLQPNVNFSGQRFTQLILQ